MKRQRAKFSVSKDHEPLIGNSGCKLRIFKDKVYKVGKESTNKINPIDYIASTKNFKI